MKPFQKLITAHRPVPAYRNRCDSSTITNNTIAITTATVTTITTTTTSISTNTTTVASTNKFSIPNACASVRRFP